MKKYIVMFLMAYSALLPAISLASNTHVHGQALLTIAAQGKDIEVVFESPAINLVGFEHKASSQADLVMLKKTKASLMLAGTLFAFKDANCKLINTDVDLSAVVDSHDQGHDQGHDQDEHEDEHHHHHSHANEDVESSHKDIIASYHFTCSALTQLTSISIGWLEQFPAISKLNVIWLIDNRQGASTLTKGANIIYVD